MKVWVSKVQCASVSLVTKGLYTVLRGLQTPGDSFRSSNKAEISALVSEGSAVRVWMLKIYEVNK